MNIAEPWWLRPGPDPDKEQWKPGRTEHATVSVETTNHDTPEGDE